MATLTALSAERPEPDGSRDARSPAQRRADALEQILDAAVNAVGLADGLVSEPKTQLLVTVPANAPDLATLQFLGPVSRAAAWQTGCDATITDIILDGEGVPLRLGREKRLFPHHLRQALIIRDACCIKCGAPASWSHAHHIQHWIDGGATDLDNGCLLCPRCHADVHQKNWEVVMGIDRHPWLIPPAIVDPQRKPLPACNRRTMQLDDYLPAAA